MTCCGGNGEQVGVAETTGLSEDPVTLMVIFGRDGENGTGEISGDMEGPAVGAWHCATVGGGGAMGGGGATENVSAEETETKSCNGSYLFWCAYRS